MNFSNLRSYITAAGGTRFLLTLGCGVVNSLLLVHGCLPAPLYRDIILGTVGVYIAARAYQKKGTDAQPPSN